MLQIQKVIASFGARKRALKPADGQWPKDRPCGRKAVAPVIAGGDAVALAGCTAASTSGVLAGATGGLLATLVVLLAAGAVATGCVLAPTGFAAADGLVVSGAKAKARRGGSGTSAGSGVP